LFIGIIFDNTDYTMFLNMTNAVLIPNLMLVVRKTGIKHVSFI